MFVDLKFEHVSWLVAVASPGRSFSSENPRLQQGWKKKLAANSKRRTRAEEGAAAATAPRLPRCPSPPSSTKRLVSPRPRPTPAAPRNQRHYTGHAWAHGGDARPRGRAGATRARTSRSAGELPLWHHRRRATGCWPNARAIAEGRRRRRKGQAGCGIRHDQ